MKPALFSPRRFFIAAVAAIAVCTAAGWGFWSWSARQYVDLVDRRIAEARAAGVDVSYDARQMFGFPRRITMRFANLHWKAPDGIDFHADDMDIVATPWNWNDYAAKFKNHASIAAPTDKDGHALTISSGHGRASVRLDGQGVWRDVRLSLDDAQMGLAPNYLFDAGKISASVSRPDTDPPDHTQAGLTIGGEADDVTIPAAMPSPFGARAEKLALHMRVMGRVPDVRRRDEVGQWNRDSGIVDFDIFDIAWGVLHVTAKGTMGFDDDLQPEGAFAGTVANPESTLQVLIKQGFIAMHDQDILASIMDMFAKPLPKGSPGMELPITVQLGGLFFGPIRIFTFPEIKWPDEPPTAQ